MKSFLKACSVFLLFCLWASPLPAQMRLKLEGGDMFLLKETMPLTVSVTKNSGERNWRMSLVLRSLVQCMTGIWNIILVNVICIVLIMTELF